MTRARDVANVLTAANLLATDTEVSAVSAQIPANVAGKNFIINGGFDIWQRGVTSSSSGYTTADRWTDYGANFITQSRQTSGAPSGSQYYLRQTSTADGSYRSIIQYIETQNSQMLFGKTITFSIKLRRNSIASNGGMILHIDKTSNVDANNSATWTQIATTVAGLAQIPTGTTSSDWYTASVTATIPNDGTANTVRAVVDYAGTTANGSVFDFAQAQLELGSTATPFSRAGGDIAGELAKCQRYYIRFGNDQNYTFIGSGNADSSTKANIAVPLPVSMRVAPTSIDYSTLLLQNNGGSAILAVTSLTFSPAAVQGKNMGIAYPTVASGLTQGTNYILASNGTTNGYLAFGAEL